MAIDDDDAQDLDSTPAPTDEDAPVAASNADASSDDDDDDSATPSPLNPIVQQHITALQAAQAQANQNSKYAELARAGASLAAGLAGSNQSVNQQPFDALDKDAQAPIVQLAEKDKTASDAMKLETMTEDSKTAADANDPDSNSSIAARAMFKKNYPSAATALTPDQFDQMSKNDVVAQLKDQETKAKIDEAANVAGMRHDAYKSQQDAKQQAAQDLMDHKDAIELDSYLGKPWAGRSGAAGALQAKINAAESAEALIAQGKTQEGGLDSRQIEELAQSTSRMLGGGSAASARVDALVPKTWLGRAQSVGEWASNSPRGADQEAFTSRMADTVAREKAVAQQQMMKYKVQGLPARSRLKTNNPDLYNSVLKGRGINEDGSDANAPAGGTSGQPDPDVAAYAAKHNVSIARAQAIKQQNSSLGGGQAPAQPQQQAAAPTKQFDDDDPAPPSFAYGGMVGGLPSSNYAASQAARPPKAPPLRMHGYADGGVVTPDPSGLDNIISNLLTGSSKENKSWAAGGQIPGTPNVPYESPSNDTVEGKLTPKEVVLPLHVTQAKHPSLAAYMFMKHGLGMK